MYVFSPRALCCGALAAAETSSFARYHRFLCGYRPKGKAARCLYRAARSSVEKSDERAERDQQTCRVKRVCARKSSAFKSLRDKDYQGTLNASQ